jgi:hypothetical protein
MDAPRFGDRDATPLAVTGDVGLALQAGFAPPDNGISRGANDAVEIVPDPAYGVFNFLGLRAGNVSFKFGTNNQAVRRSVRTTNS